MTTRQPGVWERVSEGPWSRRRKHQSVVWNDRLLILGGFDGDGAFDLNDVWAWDNSNWAQVTAHAGWSGRDGHCAVVLNGSIFILGGTDDPYNCKRDVWKSNDGGYTWTMLCYEAPWPERWQHAACIHDEKIYVTGGWGGKYLNDVWSSSDGSNWTKVCSNAPWRARMFHSIVSFNGALYIIGGHDGRMQLRDVWASTDNGTTWTQICQVAQWDGRQGHASVVLDGYVYLMGGFGGVHRFNDLWKSRDCAHWTLVDRHCTWSPRQGHACIAYRGSIYVLGGFDESGYCSDVYKLQIAASSSSQPEDFYECSNLHSLSNDESVSSVDSFTAERPGVPTVFAQSASGNGGAGSSVQVLGGGLSSSSTSSSKFRSSVPTGRVITVSITCVLESIQRLRVRRVERERLVRIMLSILGYVMQAVHFNTFHEEDENFDEQDIQFSDRFSALDYSHSADTELPLKQVVKQGAATASSRDVSDPSSPFALLPPSPPGPATDKAYSPAVTAPQVRSFAGFMSLTRKGSPLRESLLDLHKANSRKGMPTITSDEDLRMQFWRTLPMTQPSQSSSSPTVSASPLSPLVKVGGGDSGSGGESVADVPEKSDNGGVNHVDDTTAASIRSAAGEYRAGSSSERHSPELESINGLGHHLDDMHSHGSSAALREGMERDKKQMAEIQRNLRRAAEDGREDHIQALIDSRTKLAQRAAEQAGWLLLHVTTVRNMQAQRQAHLSRTLERLESLGLQIQELDLWESPRHGDCKEGIASSGSSGSSSVQERERTSSIEATGLSDHCTTWAEWEVVLQQCAEAAVAVQTDAAETAVNAFCESLRTQARLSKEIIDWMMGNEVDPSLSLSVSTGDLAALGMQNTNTGVPDVQDAADITTTASASSSTIANTSVTGPPEGLRTDRNRKPPHSPARRMRDSLDVQSEFSDYGERLAQDFESISESIDKNKMKVKKAVDSELGNIAELLAPTRALLQSTLEKGSGLIKNMIAQNRLDTVEIIEMCTEVEQWSTLMKTLRGREQVQAACDALIAENTASEENLLRLEDERIDIRSLVEKASLKRKGRSSSAGATPRDAAGVLVPVVTSVEEDLEEKKRLLQRAERSVKEARRHMRTWLRQVRKFAVETAPELFHFIPDLQAPGSVLGDGGFAMYANLPKRRLDEYDDIRPLTLDDTTGLLAAPAVAGVAGSDAAAGRGALGGGGSGDDGSGFKSSGQGQSSSSGSASTTKVNMSSGRHVLLKASYDGEEVVLKGFIMHEGDQRKGLERELSILSRLKNDAIICPGAIVEDSGTFDNPSLQVAVFIEYPFCKGGNLSYWLKAGNHKPWELQGVARQLLYGIMYLHDHGVIHKDIKPSNVLLKEDGRVVLADFELSREIKRSEAEGPGVGDDEASTTTRSGTRGFMSPEVEAGQHAVFASDMYSFGVLLLYMHYPAVAAALVPGSVHIPPGSDPDLSDLIQKLLVLTASLRPAAAAALMHPYFRSTFVERLMQEGEVVEQDRKLEAVRNLLYRARSDNRTHLDKITIHRDRMVEEMLAYFSSMDLQKMRASLRVTFVGEPGVDEGGLLTEMFTIFFEGILNGVGGLFVDSESANAAAAAALAGGSETADTSARESSALYKTKTVTATVLPRDDDASPATLKQLVAFGRAMVKALYEGRRLGSRLSPSVFKFLTDTSPDMRDLQMFDPQTARSLQWMLATVGVEDSGFHFEEVGAPELGLVNDANKSKYVRMKIDRILVHSRRLQLQAIKNGFAEALRALSEEAAPFMSLLSHTDWRVLLCGDTAVSGPQVVASLKFSGFPKKSLVPTWLKEIILSSSEDHLRKILVFVTGSPSLAGSSTSRKVEVNVRCQPRSGALPIAHTCFFHLDIPDYVDKETLQNKLIYAIQHATTFEIV